MEQGGKLNWFNLAFMRYLFKCFPVKVCISNDGILQFSRTKTLNNLLIAHFIKSPLKFIIHFLYRDVEDVIDTLRNIITPLMKQKIIATCWQNLIKINTLKHSAYYVPWLWLSLYMCYLLYVTTTWRQLVFFFFKKKTTTQKSEKVHVWETGKGREIDLLSAHSFHTNTHNRQGYSGQSQAPQTAPTSPWVAGIQVLGPSFPASRVH